MKKIFMILACAAVLAACGSKKTVEAPVEADTVTVEVVDTVVVETVDTVVAE